MEVSIGLPATVRGIDGATLLEWSRQAEAAGFAGVGAIDRTVYANYEPLIALTAAAAVTERIRLSTAILISPLHSNTALLAKQALTLDSLSEGRFTLGVAIGGRGDDYEAGGVQLEGRGRRLDAQLEEIREIFGGMPKGTAGAIGPPAVRGRGPEIIVGGAVDAAFDRAAKYAAGWIAAGGPDAFGEGASGVREAWARHGRDGEPRLASLAYFSLGDNARERADAYAHDYYAFAGPFADVVAQGIAVGEEMVKQYIQSHADAGCDELILFPCSTDLAQVELLAAAAGL